MKKPSHLPTLETPRLIIRPFVVDDAVPFYEMHQDDVMRQFLPDGDFKSVEEVKAVIEKNILGDYNQYGFGRMAVVHKEDQILLGFTGLKYYRPMDTVDVGYRFRREYWGQGLATESARPFLEYGFKEVGVDRLWAAVMPDNGASIRVLEKLGMQYHQMMEIEGDLVKTYILDRPPRFSTHEQ